MYFENNTDIVLEESTVDLIERYLTLSRSLIMEYIENKDFVKLTCRREILSAKYRTRSQHTQNDFFETTLEATLILIEKIILGACPILPGMLTGVFSGHVNSLLAKKVIFKQKIDPTQQFFIFYIQGHYYIYLLEGKYPKKTSIDILRLFSGDNKLVNLSNGKRFNYFCRLSKKQRRTYKKFSDPIKAYHEWVCQQIVVLRPKRVIFSEAESLSGKYLEEQIMFKETLTQFISGEIIKTQYR